MKNSLIFVCYRETPGLCPPTSVTRRSDTLALPLITRTVVYWDAPGHTVVPPELDKECTVATVASPGQTMINFCPKPGVVRSTAGNI